MNPLILVHGTWSRHSDWHHPGSPLWKALQGRGYTVLEFRWSGYCGGVPGPVIVPPSTDQLKGTLELWRSEGEKLALYCQRLGLEAPHVISHSHGLQVVAFAASGSGGLVLAQQFGTVLSLSGPVREDMTLIRGWARSHIRRWIQVTDPTGEDTTILEGEAFDGHLGWVLALPEADQNIEAPGAGHSGLVAQFDDKEWEELGLWKALEGGTT